MRLFKRSISLLVLAALASAAGAADRSAALYRGEVPLEAADEVPWAEPQEGEESASEEEEGEEELDEDERRERLIRLALGRVLVRLTGAQQVTADGMVRHRLLERAGDFVERYQYLAATEDDPARLRVRFSQEGVWEALQETGWPVWGSPRPALLVWVAVRHEEGWRLASADGYPELFDKLRRTARARGLPLVFPLLDGTDRRNLSASDLLFLDWERIRAASRRYDPDAVLVLRAYPSESEDEGRLHWTVRFGELNAAFTTRKGQADDWVAGGVQRLVAFWGHRFAVFPGEESRLEVVVEGVESLADFAAVQNALGEPSSVNGVRPAGFEEGTVRFRVRFQGRPADLEGTLSLHNDLSALGGSAQDGKQVLRFAYRP